MHSVYGKRTNPDIRLVIQQELKYISIRILVVMNPKYSILLVGQTLEEYKSWIDAWLHQGVKVIWFGSSADEGWLKEKYSGFTKAFLMQAYVWTPKINKVIVDGEDPDHFVEKSIQRACPRFNAAQYMVEHCNPADHIIVQASAGTGKTTVMIDRVMYLIHTQPDLHLSEIYMITFTNDAAQQMSRKLQDVLMDRFYLTGQKRYLSWLEEQSQMNISTIHSFAHEMLRRFGINEGFTEDLSIRTFKYERKELIKDIVDEQVDDRQTVADQLGLSLYEAESRVNDFWEEFTRLGISHQDMSRLDWGQADSPRAASFQHVLSGVLRQVDDRYFDIKRKTNAVSLNDIMRDLELVLQDKNLPHPDIRMKYLFIDEFQDTDLAQIVTSCIIVRMMSACLFVVGDVKQSIYRFRGASDRAFEKLKETMAQMHMKRPDEYTLINNYRTSERVLARLNAYFEAWGRMGRLKYTGPVLPFNKSNGRIRFIEGLEKEEGEQQLAQLVGEELNGLIRRVETSDINPDEKTRVVMLTRSNSELYILSRLLKKAHIPASVKQDGNFYESEAVRDFYIMALSFLFSDEPKYIFNYLLTPYAGQTDPLDINEMEFLNGDYDDLVDYLDHFLDQTSWKKYHKELRLRPILSVLKEIVDQEHVVEHFVQNLKQRKRAEGWEEERLQTSVHMEALQYQADLEKLMEILQRNFDGEKVSIYKICEFLKNNIAANRTESAAEVTFGREQTKTLYKSVLCMTVHKAKGLEFDTVVIPFTGRAFPGLDKSGIIVNPADLRVGWDYSGSKSRKASGACFGNDIYAQLSPVEQEKVNREEVRILYVAMTRAVNNLICVVQHTRKKNSWAKLIERAGVGDE